MLTISGHRADARRRRARRRRSQAPRSPNSLARSRARASLASDDKRRARHGFIAAARRRSGMTGAWPEFMRGAACLPRRKAAARSALGGKRHVVAMDHFGAAGRRRGDGRCRANCGRGCARRAARRRRSGRARSPPRARRGWRRSRRAENAPSTRVTPAGSRLLPRGERGGGAGVDEHRALELKRPADPDLARRDRVRRGEEPGAAAALGDARDRMRRHARRR